MHRYFPGNSTATSQSEDFETDDDEVLDREDEPELDEENEAGGSGGGFYLGGESVERGNNGGQGGRHVPNWTISQII
jgi:hypothetical protein